MAFAGVIAAAVYLADKGTGKSAESSPPPAAQSTDDKIMAWVMAQRFVRERLKSPGSADFGSIFGENQDPNECVNNLGAGKYRVKGWVDSQNAFGAKRRAYFTVTLERTGNDNWNAVEGPELFER